MDQETTAPSASYAHTPAVGRRFTLQEIVEGTIAVELKRRGDVDLAERVTKEATGLLQEHAALAQAHSTYSQQAARYHQLPAHDSQIVQVYLAETERIATLNAGEPTIVQRAKLHMLNTYAAGASLDTIAADLGYSKEHLARAFKKHTGMTVVDYRRRLRISAALMGMANTDRSLKAAAFDAGFQSYNDFYRNFKKELGRKPQEVFAELHAAPELRVMLK